VQTRLLALAVLAVIFVGCNGGTVDRHSLTNDAATIDSMACEGALLADNVAHGKTTTFYAREQAEELEIQSSNLADALAERHSLPAIEQRVRAKARVAAKLSTTLKRLHEHPSDRVVAAAIEQRLKRLGSCS
jgi:hypothetical protein